MAIPLVTHRVSPSDVVLTTLRLVWIEVRRGAGLFAVPVFFAVIWFALNVYVESTSSLLWPAASLNVAFTAVLLAPVVAGLLAWEGGREGRRRMGDLLVTMPGHAIRRDLARWVGTTAWAILAYVTYGVYALLPVARAATWGGPMWDALALGVAVIAAAGAIGYAVGVTVPSRFVPPVVTVALYGIVVGLVALQPDDQVFDLKYLTPYSAFGTYWPSDVGLYQQFQPDIFIPMTAWMLAVGAVAFSALALLRGVTRASQGAVVAAAVFALAAATPLVPAAQHENGWMRPRLVTYEPVCQTETIQVCVHPALEPLLPGYAATIGALVAPIAGVPGGVVRALPTGASGQTGVSADGTFRFYLWTGLTDDITTSSGWLAEQLVIPGSGRFDSTPESCAGWQTNARFVVIQALAHRVSPGSGYPDERGQIITCEMVPNPMMFQGFVPETPEILAMRAEIAAAIDRFTALTLDQQRAWFADNLVALRAGDLTLEDLP
ncbi:MAG: hypothetical protein M3462_02355 [Chloroflexota bacterium]|nr:hypothetical protein [Chloroflexota bacterium]